MPATEDLGTDGDSVERYRALLDASRRLNRLLDLEELYPAIYREVSAFLEAPAFYLALHDAGRDLARVVFCAERGVARRVDVPYRGSDSAVISAQHASIVSEELEQESLMTLGDEESEPTLSAVSAPLMLGGRVLGVVSAQSYEADAFDDDDLRALEQVAEVAAVALNHAIQYAELDRRREEAEQLEKIGRALASKLDPDQVLRQVVTAVTEVLHLDGVSVWLRDPDDGGRKFHVAAAGGDIALPESLEWEITDELAEVLLDDQKPYVIDNLAGSPLLPEHVATHLSVGSGVGVPLVLNGRVEGVLAAGSRQPRRFDREDVGVLQRLASHASFALGNARLLAKLQNMSLTDPLTNLPNRRRLEIHMKHEVAAARRGRPIGVAMFDIDGFKACNDTYGHLAGDQVLQAFAGVLDHEVRAMNLAVRFGGDEFVAVLSDTDLPGVRHFVERVREHVVGDETLSKFGVSVSAGCAVFDEDTMSTAEDVLHAADADLYEQRLRPAPE
jgi:diguanylate cyclase (GGDEF)-like protein